MSGIRSKVFVFFDNKGSQGGSLVLGSWERIKLLKIIVGVYEVESLVYVGKFTADVLDIAEIYQVRFFSAEVVVEFL